MQFEELPKWTFTVVEVAPGGYRVSATRDGGIRGEGMGEDPDALLAEFREWAHRVDEGLESRDDQDGRARTARETRP